MMNPNTNKFEKLVEMLGTTTEVEGTVGRLVRPDGSEVPKHWSVFTVGEEVVIKNYTFRIAYIGESTLLLEPVGIPIIGTDNNKRNRKKRVKKKRRRG
jgi:hypothetical protein